MKAQKRMLTSKPTGEKEKWEQRKLIKQKRGKQENKTRSMENKKYKISSTPSNSVRFLKHVTILHIIYGHMWHRKTNRMQTKFSGVGYPLQTGRIQFMRGISTTSTISFLFFNLLRKYSKNANISKKDIVAIIVICYFLNYFLI